MNNKKTKNKPTNKPQLRYQSVYLCGAIEAADDLGVGWRAELAPFIEEELEHKVLDPCALEEDKLKGLHYNRLPEGFNHWHELKNSKNPAHIARFMRYMRRIIEFDIEIIREESGYLIVLWDSNAAKGAGSHAEMTIAFLEGLPVYCVNIAKVHKPWYWRLFYNIGQKLGLHIKWPTSMPAWLRACCTEVFDDIEQLKEHLIKEFVEER